VEEGTSREREAHEAAAYAHSLEAELAEVPPPHINIARQQFGTPSFTGVHASGKPCIACYYPPLRVRPAIFPTHVSWLFCRLPGRVYSRNPLRCRSG